MIDQTQKFFYAAISLMISVFLHFIMWIGAEHFKMRSLDRQRTIKLRETQLDMIEMKVISRPDETLRSIDLSNILSQQKEVLKNLFKKEGLVELPQPSHLPRTKKSATYRIKSLNRGGKRQTRPLSILPQELVALAPKSAGIKNPSKERHYIHRIKHNQKFKLVPSSVPELNADTRTLTHNVFESELKVPSDRSDMLEISTVPENMSELLTVTRPRTPKEKMKVLDSVLTATAKLYVDPATGGKLFSN